MMNFKIKITLPEYLLAFMVAYCLHYASGECSECKPQDIDTTLVVCREFGSKLEQTEASSTNKTLVCSCLAELFECIGTHVPQCMGKLGNKYQRFTMTPWDCHMSPDQILVIQKLVNARCGPTKYSPDVSGQLEGAEAAKVHSDKSQPTNTCTHTYAGYSYYAVLLLFLLL